MIKIQEHLGIPDPEAFLDGLAKELWQELNPMLANGSGYKQTSLIMKCQKYLAKTVTSDYIKNYAGNSKAIANRHQRFFRYLLAYKARRLKQLIVAKPSDFSAIKNAIFNFVRPVDLYYTVQGKIVQTPFGELISETIFNYKNFRKSKYCADLFSRLKAHGATCPYCNDTILKIVDIRVNPTSERKMRAYLDLDHFYPKSQNPFFSVSFFNLIPTCHACNATDKGDKPFSIETHIHPYHEAFDDLYTFKVSAVAQLGVPPNEIGIDKTGNKPLDRTLLDLLLTARYQHNLEEVLDMVNYYNNYKWHIGTVNEQAFIDSFYKMRRVPKFRKDILKRPQGKLLRDILKVTDGANNYLDLK